MQKFLLCTLVIFFQIHMVHADSTVRTAAHGVKTLNSIENMKALYSSTINVIRGDISALSSELENIEQRLAELRRLVRNMQPVIYKTDRIIIDYFDVGSDDGGGGGVCG